MATNGFHPLEALMRERIVLLDGAMGTMIQRYKLSEAVIIKAKISKAVSSF